MVMYVRSTNCQHIPPPAPRWLTLHGAVASTTMRIQLRLARQAIYYQHHSTATDHFFIRFLLLACTTLLAVIRRMPQLYFKVCYSKITYYTIV
jgi:hypothetical protein